MGDEASLTTTTMGTPRTSTIPWDEKVLGTMGALSLKREKGFKPGTSYDFKSFLFDYSMVITITTKMEGEDETDLLDGEKRTLYRSVSSMDLMPGLKTKEWSDENGEVFKTSLNMMGLTIETFRTTEERAQKTEGSELNADMIIESMARSNVLLPNPYRLDAILYQFKVKDADLGMPEDLGDVRQKVLENDGQVATVLIKAVTPETAQARPLENPPPELEEYLSPNAFIQSDHPPLKAKALEIVGEEKDAWKAACLLERFVRVYIEDKNFTTGFASAAEVFDNPTGDCSEHGVLLAALCRAVGIPARVAMGYMYLGGIFGGHMWAEVWINNEWYPIDGVMGIGRVDPTHIRFTSSSLDKGGLGESFMTAVQGLGNLDITILEFTRGEKTVNVNESFKDFVIDGNTYTNTLYGVSITKPEGYVFEDYERDFSGIDFTLVELEGESDAELMAIPAVFSFTLEQLKEEINKKGVEILSETPKEVQGRGGIVLATKEEEKRHRLLALIDEDTCYVLKMRIEDEDRDLDAFEALLNSFRLLKE
jgi:hypothetical protein